MTVVVSDYVCGGTRRRTTRMQSAGRLVVNPPTADPPDPQVPVVQIFQKIADGTEAQEFNYVDTIEA
jgi:hypothetical protein